MCTSWRTWTAPKLLFTPRNSRVGASASRTSSVGLAGGRDTSLLPGRSIGPHRGRERASRAGHGLVSVRRRGAPRKGAPRRLVELLDAELGAGSGEVTGAQV